MDIGLAVHLDMCPSSIRLRRWRCSSADCLTHLENFAGVTPDLMHQHEFPVLPRCSFVSDQPHLTNAQQPYRVVPQGYLHQ